MAQNDILSFNPTSLSVFNKETPDYKFFDEPKRERNYPIEDYHVNDFVKPQNYIDTVIWVYNQMKINSETSIDWLRSTQYHVKSDKETKAHINKNNQILSHRFQTIIFTKMNDILNLAKKFESKCDVYEFPLSYYKELKLKFIDYLYGDDYKTDTKTYIQLEWFVEGIFKHIMSAEWDYEHFNYILENQKYSKTYKFDNGKWVAISK